jgi:YD repeat-containing protein
MRKNTHKSVVAALKAGMTGVSQTQQKAAIRATVMFLMITLLMPIFLFNPIGRTQAQSSVGSMVQQPAPISAPPEPFVIGSAASNISSSVVSALSTLQEFFSAPQPPEGFEIIKTPTFREKIFSSLGATFGAIFGISDSSTKNNETNLSSNSSSNIPSNSTNSTNLMFGQLSGAVDFDFDGDQKADIARWHASNTEWKIKTSLNGSYRTETIGSTSSIIAPGDFDGDRTMDVAMFNAGAWTIKTSSNGQTITGSFGTTGDKPVVGDYDGDGKSDLAVFRPSTATWWILYSGNLSYTSIQFGSSSDIPVQGKFDDDGITDIAFFRPSTGAWHIQGSNSGFYTINWGSSSDIPVPADYDGDHKTDLAVFRGSTGTWWVLKSSTGYASYQSQAWGNSGDQPVPADYDGDEKADYSVWRPTTGTWYTIKSNGTGYDYQTLGVAGDTAVSSAYLKQIGGLVYSYDFAKTRLSPKNSTGGTDLYSRNFSWRTGLVGLPGRAGLDAGFGISYNSLIWTKDTNTNTVVFDADNSNVTPGFRFGFPTIEPVYFNAATGKFAFLMVSPSGARVEFRQTAATDVYETADSSYAQLKINNSGSPNSAADSLTLTVTNTSGTSMLYEWKNGAYRCQKITDRNGNYIEISHDADGKLQTVTDTLGRIITVFYNTDNLPSSITQAWKDENGKGSIVTHTWATFTYTTQAITTKFRDSLDNPLPVVGPGDGFSIKVLQKIKFPTETNGDGPNTVFTYNTWGQVTKITNYAADNHELNYTRVNLPAGATGAESDCPRFTETYTAADSFNGGSEVTIKNTYTENVPYTLPDSTTQTGTRIEIKAPDGSGNADKLVTKIYSASSGWAESLPAVTEDWAEEGSGLVKKRWTWSNWTQDDVTLSYISNPRVEESKIGDATNIKRSTTEYYKQGFTNIANYGRVKKVQIYAADGTTVWKKIETGYNDSSAYLSRRMISLPTLVKVSGYDQSDSLLKLVSFATYAYDEGNFSDSALEQNISSVIQHDNANFSSSFITGRGNLTSTTRCDANYTTSCTNGITSSVKYNIAGGVVAQTGPAPNSSTRTVKISYTDKFHDRTSRNTYAYPTKLYDPAGYFSEVEYRFDTGANVWAQSPGPGGNSTGKETSRLYDSVGRLEKETLVNTGANTGAYSRYEYPTNGIQSKVYSTVIDTDGDGADVDDEVLSESWTDGAGRVRRSRTENPNSTGGWTGTLTEYNILGQVVRSTVPTEISVSNANNPDSWSPSGDDATRGWLWNSQEYDWKGRVTRKIPSDSDGTDGKDQLFSYDGCGCAGKQITTIQSELVPRDDVANTNARRTQKIHEDILGRTDITEVMGWDGSTAYTTTKQTYNGRGQIVKTQQYSGTTSSPTYQDVTMTYDGYGRMKTRHYPIEDPNTETTWNYNADDSIQDIIDPRGAITNFTYDTRGLVSQIAYDPPSGQSAIADSPTVTFQYDALGNRTSMDTAGISETTYVYDSLSRLTSETVNFDDLTEDLTVAYTYNLGGGLKSVTDPFGSIFDYTNDKTGRLTAVKSGSGYSFLSANDNYVSGIQYRAFGAVKQLTDGMDGDDATISMSYDNRLRASQYQAIRGTSTTIKNSSFEYNADSRPKVMTDAFNATFNRTFQYDFAGRLTKNGFGTAVNPQTLEAVQSYRQNIVYDAFSQITTRSTATWEKDAFFTRDYSNGRLQPHGTIETITYNAAGNIVYQGRGTNDFQQTGYDAAGRRATFGEKYVTSPSVLHDDTTSEYYDGGGNSVKTVENRSHKQWNEPTYSTLTTTTYKIRSSVLGEELSTLIFGVYGEERKTKVFAGGAVVAEQHSLPDTTTPDEITWYFADPVTGSRETWMQNGSYTTSGGEEYEPLGQKIRTTMPIDLDQSPPYTSVGNDARFPEWQCQAFNEKGPNLTLPTFCGLKILEDGTRWAGGKRALTPGDLSKLFGSKVTMSYNSEFDNVMKYTISATAKKKTKDEKDDMDKPEIALEEQFEVTVSAGDEAQHIIDVTDTGVISAEFGLSSSKNKYTNSNKDIRKALEDADLILSGDNECSKFFGKYWKQGLLALDKKLNKGVVDNNNQSTGIRQEMDKPNDFVGDMSPTSDGNIAQKKAYRVFETATVNSFGPFFNPKSPAKIGGYYPASRESRVLQILHELAHMIYKSNYELLIPNDLGSGLEGQSEINTDTILNDNKCKAEIDKLGEKK